MASREGDAYYEIVSQGNPLAVTLDGTHNSIHNVQDLIKRASNVLTEEAMMEFLEVLAKVLLLKKDASRSIIGVGDYLWFPLSKENHNEKWLCQEFLQAYYDACCKLMMSPSESEPEQADLIRVQVKQDLIDIYNFMI